MIIFSGYIISGKQKKNFSIKDIDLAFQCGTIFNDKKSALHWCDKNEKVSKLTISVVKKRKKKK